MGNNKHNLIGNKYDRLTVLEKCEERNKHGAILWFCQCSCGNTTTLTTHDLIKRGTGSCGCKMFDHALKDITGKKFGRLTAIRRIPDSNNKSGSIWECKCDCGQTYHTALCSLNAGHVKSCGCLRIENGIKHGLAALKPFSPGEKISNFTVIERDLKKEDYSRSWWICKCICGNIVSVDSATLRRVKKSKYASCGCINWKRKRLPPGVAGFNKLFGSYKRGAAQRKLDFTLTEEQFRDITKQPCHYCDTPPAKISRATKHKHKSGKLKDQEEYLKNSEYVYNGIDRKDPLKGYTPENSVPCCFVCNYFKIDKGYEEFLNLIEKIYLNTHKPEK